VTRRRAIVIYVLAGTIWNAACLGHGVEHNVLEGGVGIEVNYDDGTPMRFCEVMVFSPLDNGAEFQQGFTDRNGRFAFFPDTTGTWHVAADDGMGHAISEDIDVREGMRIPRNDTSGFHRFEGAVIGVSLIFGLFGVTSFLLRRRRS